MFEFQLATARICFVVFEALYTKYFHYLNKQLMFVLSNMKWCAFQPCLLVSVACGVAT